MSKVMRTVLLSLFVLGCTLGLGCSGEDEGKPNPELKVPDIKPGNKGNVINKSNNKS